MITRGSEPDVESERLEPKKPEKEKVYLLSSDSEADFMEYDAPPLSKRKTENIHLDWESDELDW
jgi:hypothetical protein